MIIYEEGTDLPDIELSWYDSSGALRNFSTGYTFQVLVGKPGGTALINKTTGIVGAATAPNIKIVWDNGQLSSLSPGKYEVRIITTQTSNSKKLSKTLEMSISDAITAA